MSTLTAGGVAVAAAGPPFVVRLPPGTELVIEAPPRSAQTFLVTVFEAANPAVLTVHHSHHGETLVAAAQAGVPAVAILRDPLDSCASHLVYDEQQTPTRVLRRWLRFWGPVEELEGVHLVTFEQVIRVAGVVPGINAAYRTRFRAPHYSARHPGGLGISPRIFAELDEYAAWKWPKGEDFVRRAPFPHVGRAELNAAARAELRACSLLPAARALYLSLSP